MNDHATLATLVARDLRAGLCDAQTLASVTVLCQHIAAQVTGRPCYLITEEPRQ
jgi:hypothetical protein